MLMMETTRLIERCRVGDTEALGELYKAYAQRMRGVCRRYVSDELDVDDVLHDAFIIIFTSFDRLRDVSKAEGWMMSITRNVASKYKDHLDSQPFVPLREAESLAAPDEKTGVRGVPLEDVLRMVERLPEGYGQVFRLSVFDGMSHKEIAAMLGIEAHSSSSQLARAKKMLRKMMQQYWAVFLLLLVPVSIWLLSHRNKPQPSGNSSRVVATADTTLQGAATPLPTKGGTGMGSLVARKDTSTMFLPNRAIPDSSTVEPSLLDNRGYAQFTPEETPTAGDSTSQGAATSFPSSGATGVGPEALTALTSSVAKTDDQRRSLYLAYAGGFDDRRANRPYGFTETPIIDITGTVPSPSPVTFESWSDYAAYLSELPDDGTSHTRSVIMNIALNNANQPGNDKILRTSHHSMPFTWSLALRYKLSNRFGLESGLSYSLLTSDFKMGADGNVIREQQTIHYLGIPIKGIYNMYVNKRWGLYGSLSLTMEIPVHSPLTTSYYLHGALEATEKTILRAPWQWSLGTGLGLQYNFTPSVGLFVEPSLQYYFPMGSNVETYRTEHPFTFSLPLGIRFTW